MRYLRPNLTKQNSLVPILSKLDSRLIGTPGSVSFSKTYSLAVKGNDKENINLYYNKTGEKSFN